MVSVILLLLGLLVVLLGLVLRQCEISCRVTTLGLTFKTPDVIVISCVISAVCSLFNFVFLCLQS